MGAAIHIDSGVQIFFTLIADQADQVIECGRDDHRATWEALEWGGWGSMNVLFIASNVIVDIRVPYDAPLLALADDTSERARLAYNRAAQGQVWKTPELVDTYPTDGDTIGLNIN